MQATMAEGTITPEQASKVLAHVGDHTITARRLPSPRSSTWISSIACAISRPSDDASFLKEMINIQILADEAVAKGYDKDPLAQQEVRSVLRNAMMDQAHVGAPTPNAIPEGEVRAYFDTHRDQFNDPERRRISVIVLADDKNARATCSNAPRRRRTPSSGASSFAPSPSTLRPGRTCPSISPATTGW